MTVLQIDPGWATSSLLLWLRLAALFFMTPLFAGFKGPFSVQIILSLALAATLSAAWQQGHAVEINGLGGLLMAALSELFIGMLLAFGVHAAFAAFAAAGSLLDLQIGFSASTAFDPVTRNNAPVLAVVFSSLAVVVFFSLDAHHAFLRGLAFSVSELPPGSWPKTWSADPLIRQFGAIFTLGLSLAAPAFAVLLLVDAGLAVLSRAMPQMSVYFVGMPVKLLLGLGALAASAPVLSSVMSRAFASIFVYWGRVLH